MEKLELVQRKMNRTIEQWSDIYKVVVLDPDGFDRTDPDLYKKRIDQKTWEVGLMRSTINPIRLVPSVLGSPFEEGCIVKLSSQSWNSNAAIVKSIRLGAFNQSTPSDFTLILEISALPEPIFFKNTETINSKDCSFIMSAKEFEKYKSSMTRKVIKRDLCAGCEGKGSIHFCKYCVYMMESIHAYNLIYETWK